MKLSIGMPSKAMWGAVVLALVASIAVVIGIARADAALDTSVDRPEVYRGSADSNTGVLSITWRDTDNDPATIKGYLIHDNYQYSGWVKAPALSYTVTGIEPGTVHRFQVRAQNLAGDWSNPSRTFKVTMPGDSGVTPLLSPTDVAASLNEGVNPSPLTLSWNDPNSEDLKGYLVHDYGQFIRFVPTGTTSIQIDVEPDSQHGFEVRAQRLDGTYSAPSPIEKIDVPGLVIDGNRQCEVYTGDGTPVPEDLVIQNVGDTTVTCWGFTGVVWDAEPIGKTWGDLDGNKRYDTYEWIEDFFSPFPGPERTTYYLYWEDEIDGQPVVSIGACGDQFASLDDCPLVPGISVERGILETARYSNEVEKFGGNNWSVAVPRLFAP